MNIKDDKTKIQSVKDGIVSGITLSSFSDDANSEFKKSITKYVDILNKEAIETAERHGAQQVSDNDVKRATRYLFTYTPPQSKNKLKDFLIMSGYTLIGVWLTIVVELIIGQISSTTTIVILSSLFLFVGVIMLYFGFNKD